MKVSNFYNKNQFIIKSQEEIIFQSYDSTIAIINRDNGNLTLGFCWDYSKTTSKHLYLFLDDYFYNLNEDLQNELRYLNRDSNKRKTIQKLIDNHIIEYDESLR